jgi:hypothetical protein
MVIEHTLFSELVELFVLARFPFVKRGTERITRKFQQGNSVAIGKSGDNGLKYSGCRGR